jgi:hypothetical protein
MLIAGNRAEQGTGRKQQTGRDQLASRGRGNQCPDFHKFSLIQPPKVFSALVVALPYPDPGRAAKRKKNFGDNTLPAGS